MDSLYLEMLTALGHGERMALFRLLVRRYPDFLPAGEIASIQGLKQNTASVYLAALTRARLLEQRRDGRRVLYRAGMTGAEDLVAYLFADCCRGRPEICIPDTAAGRNGAAAMLPRKFNALFICTGNSARSIFAEALLRDIAGERFNAFSAGTHPAPALNPIAVKLLRDGGHDVSELRAKHVSEFHGRDAPVMDFVFTVCDQAANEDCPAWVGQPVTAHWGVPDPAAATGTDAEKALAFRQAYGILKNRISMFAAMQPENLERARLQGSVDAISQEGEPA